MFSRASSRAARSCSTPTKLTPAPPDSRGEHHGSRAAPEVQDALGRPCIAGGGQQGGVQSGTVAHPPLTQAQTPIQQSVFSPSVEAGAFIHREP